MNPTNEIIICSTTLPEVSAGSASITLDGVCPCPTPTPTPTLTKTLTPTPTPTTTPTATATCIQYNITSSLSRGSSITFDGCCGNAGQTGASIAVNSTITRCSTTLPVVTSFTATITAVGACSSC